MNFSFCTENSDYAEKAREKYELPYIARSKIEKIHQISKETSYAYKEMEKSIDKYEYTELSVNAGILEGDKKSG